MYYLYLKTHKVTGLKYLGVTGENDPFKYPGSGHYWKRHLKTHGKDISTQILFETEDKQILRKRGLEYSEKWNVVESDEFANLRSEDGFGISAQYGKDNPFYGKKHSKEALKIIGEKSSERNMGVGNPMYGKSHSKEVREKISKNRKGITKGVPKSKEQREKMSIARKKWWAKKCKENTLYK